MELRARQGAIGEVKTYPPCAPYHAPQTSFQESQPDQVQYFVIKSSLCT